MKHGKINKEEQNKSGAAGNWMMTFNDLLTLLFTFFVLLLAFSTLQTDYVAQAAKSFRKSLAGGLTAEGVSARVFKPFIPPVRDADIEAEKEKNARRDVETMHRMRTKLLKVMEISPGASITDWPRGMSLEFPSAAVFEPADGEIGKRGYELLARLREVFQQEAAFIRVEVYDGTIPARESGRGSYNGSAIRAAAIAETMTALGGLEAKRVSASGHGPRKEAPADGDGMIRIRISARYI